MTTQITSIVISDDHAIFRQGLRKLFDEQAEFRIVGEAASGAETIQVVNALQPDILLLDLQLGDMTGIDVLRKIGPTAKGQTILLGADIRQEDELNALLLGASGVVGKYSAAETLFKCIRAVRTGEMWMKRDTVKNLVSMMRGNNSPGSNQFGLTTRELEIVRAVVQGLGNREISEMLGISQFTVKHYLTRVFDKLLVGNRVELALFATRHGLARNSVRTTQ